MKNMVVIRLTVLTLVLCMGGVAGAGTTLEFTELPAPTPYSVFSGSWFGTSEVAFGGESIFREDSPYFVDDHGIYNGTGITKDIVMEWVNPVSTVNFDYVLVTHTNNLLIIADAYDTFGNLLTGPGQRFIGSGSISGSGSVSAPSIKKVIWHDGGNIIGLDKVSWETNAIPAPGAFFLGTLGTGLVGWFRKRR